MSEPHFSSSSSSPSPPLPNDRPLSPFRGISPVNFLFEGCNEEGIIHFHRTRLESMMKMSKNGRLPSPLRRGFEAHGLPGLENRARAIRWIKKVSWGIINRKLQSFLRNWIKQVVANLVTPSCPISFSDCLLFFRWRLSPKWVMTRESVEWRSLINFLWCLWSKTSIYMKIQLYCHLQQHQRYW